MDRGRAGPVRLPRTDLRTRQVPKTLVWTLGPEQPSVLILTFFRASVAGTGRSAEPRFRLHLSQGGLLCGGVGLALALSLSPPF